MKLLAGFVICAWSMSIFAHADVDPLFQNMQGAWEGEGSRTQVVSGGVTQLTVHSNSVVEGTRLVSSSLITESDPPRSYSRAYWIRGSGETLTCSASMGRSYELGVGSGAEETVLSHGCFSGNTFQVDQVLGTDPLFVVHSSTRFERDGESIYSESTQSGERQLSHATIHYRRHN